MGEGEVAIPWGVAPHLPTRLHNGSIVVRTAIQILRGGAVIPFVPPQTRPLRSLVSLCRADPLLR